MEGKSVSVLFWRTTSRRIGGRETTTYARTSSNGLGTASEVLMVRLFFVTVKSVMGTAKPCNSFVVCLATFLCVAFNSRAVAENTDVSVKFIIDSHLYVRPKATGTTYELLKTAPLALVSLRRESWEFFMLPMLRNRVMSSGDAQLVRLDIDHIMRVASFSFVNRPDGFAVCLGKQRIPFGDFATEMPSDDGHPLRPILEVDKRIGITLSKQAKVPMSSIKLLTAEASAFSDIVDDEFFSKGMTHRLSSSAARLRINWTNGLVITSSLIVKRNSNTPNQAVTMSSLAARRRFKRTDCWIESIFFDNGEALRYSSNSSYALTAGVSFDVARCALVSEATIIDAYARQFGVGLRWTLPSGVLGPEVRITEFAKATRKPTDYVLGFHWKMQLPAWHNRVSAK
jgi:hypothetical protein